MTDHSKSTRQIETLIGVALLLVAGVVTDASFQSSGATRASSQTRVFAARVIRVIDGDTIVVSSDGASQVRVRVEGVDCPESGQAFSQAARNFTRRLVFDQAVSITVVDRDRYGRIVGRVTARSKDLGLELVKAGLAWHYTWFSADRLLEAAEKEAKAQRRGVWTEPNPVPPWVYRRPQSVPENVGPFHGNTASGVYHSDRCRNARCHNCSRVFGTESEAQAAGFRPAGDCLKVSR